MAQSPRGLAAFLFFLALSCQARARKDVFRVEGTSFDGGLYAEEQTRNRGWGKHYKRLGAAGNDGWTFYLYRGTQRRGTWVFGNGNNEEGRRFAIYRAPAGSAADRPPLDGWEYVQDGSTDGKEIGEDSSSMRVTGFQLDEKETAAGVFKRGGGRTVEGIICRTDDDGNVVCWFTFIIKHRKGRVSLIGRLPSTFISVRIISS